MATKKSSKAFVRLVRSMVKFTQRLSSKQAVRYYRNLFLLLIKPRRQGQMGFVLPTVTMLILVLGLVVSAMIFRGYNRSVDTIASFQDKKIDNVAAPAVDRARAKIRYLLSEDQAKEYRSPPREEELETILLNEANPKYPNFSPSGNSFYTLPDETQENIEYNGNKVPAWRYVKDMNGNGASATDPDDITTIYAIVLRATRGSDTIDANLSKALPTTYTLLGNEREKRKEKLLVSRGPLELGTPNQLCIPQYDTTDAALQTQGPDGWFPTASASYLKKNFQTFAIAVPNKVIMDQGANLAVSTIEYQQDWGFELPGKYGAWFRYDIELYTGPPFTWNGAMHTEGSLFIRGRDGFRAFLISGPSSCFYDPALNSEISLVKQLVWKIPSRPASESIQIGKVGFDVYKNNDPSVFLDESTDTSSASGNNTINVMLNPQDILTLNQSNYIGTGAGYQDKKLTEMSTGNAIGARIARKIRKAGAQGEDIEEKAASQDDIKCPISLDDTYRADDRYGPKPHYQTLQKANRCQIVDTTAMGATLTSNDEITNTPPATKPDDYGLDGYWERRARGQGLRIIVGQRLELGNPFGWKSADDPLNPYDTSVALPTNMTGRRNELLQRRTLRDNLAAVQATLVYSKDTSSGDEPVAVVATTVHPGTEQTLKDSSTFVVNSAGEPNTNFFVGKGTNGWEFDPPAMNATMDKALNNLANFAGDPDGAYPLTTQNSTVHPYPLLTMWGNFSNLRKYGLTGNSLADQTTKQTAAATLGLLAYNIKKLQDFSYTAPPAPFTTTDLTDLNSALEKLVTTTPSLADGAVQIKNMGTQAVPDYQVKVTPAGSAALSTQYLPLPPEIKGNPLLSSSYPPLNPIIPSNNNPDPNAPNVDRPATGDYRARPEDYIAALPKKYQQLAWIIHLKNQVERDRNVTKSFTPNATPSNCGDIIDPAKGNAAYTGIKSKLCDNAVTQKFPSLYYLFPTANHGENQAPRDTTGGYIKTTNATVQYQAFADTDFTSIALKPRAISSWKLPNATATPSTTVNAPNPNSSSMELISVCSDAGCSSPTYRKVALKDSAFFDGREAMSVRFLNIDLSLLKDHALMPTSGIIYAFREDAVREDAILRPVGTTMNLGNPPTDPALLTRNISKKPIDYYPDPDRRPYGFRLKNGKNISRANVPAKEVGGMTFVSDNPIYIQGNFNLHTNNASDTENKLDEFSDFYRPPISNTGSNPIPVTSSVSPNKSFYDPDRKLDPNFGRKGKDNWRPVDIVGDTVGILSDNFCDGSIEDGIVNAGTVAPTANLSGTKRKDRYGCNTNSDYTSYLNQNRPMTATPTGTNWLRENPADTTSPVVINKQGMHRIINAGNAADYGGTYLTFNQGGGTAETAGKKRIVASQTTANMILVSGIVPTRLNQQNGGLHNFPRMMEDWKDTTLLTIKGSLMQLRFSNYGTASYDQTPWEPTGNATTALTEVTDNTADTKYYQPPARNWGYDLALQYNPPTPVTRRGDTNSQGGDEFYREPKADDPYICLLRSKLTNFECK